MKKLFSTFIPLCLITAMTLAQEAKTEVDPKDNAQKTIVEVKEGEKAKEEYDAEAVILVKTKIKTDLKPQEYNLGANDNKGIYIRSYVGSAGPIIFIDGKLENQETLAILNPDSIQSISVLNNEEALKK